MAISIFVKQKRGMTAAGQIKICTLLVYLLRNGAVKKCMAARNRGKMMVISRIASMLTISKSW